ncbi:MAG: UbiA family prenyltransferase [Planctomycetota bacterium]
MKIPPQVRLLRPALVPTAIADVVTGAAWASGDAPVLKTALAAMAGACIYMGGMVLNDLADRDKDVYLAPDRPLVRHPGLASQAWGMVLVLFTAGILLAIWAGVPLLGAMLAGLAVLYDVGAKKTFPADALTLGGARAANMAMGVGVAGGPWDFNTWTLLLGYGLYIAAITAISRTEDFKDGGLRRKWLAAALAPLLIACGAMSSLAEPGGGITLFLVPSLALAVAVLHAMKDGTGDAAKRLVLRCLLCIFLLQGVLLWSTDHFVAASIIAALGALSIYLLRAMRPPKKDEATSSSPA